MADSPRPRNPGNDPTRGTRPGSGLRTSSGPQAGGTGAEPCVAASFEAGGYELTVIDITEDADEHTADLSTTGRVTVRNVENPARGKIDFSGDVDWFKLQTAAGATYQIDLEGQATGRGSLRDPVLRGVFGADGNYIPGTRNDNGGEGDNARVTVDLPVGIYYVAVGAFGYREGTYTLSVDY